MHLHTNTPWEHQHDFSIDTSTSERNTQLVVILTGVMMVVEILSGYLFGSMALLADGWHMGTHMAALTISLFAYRYARRHADNPRYSFGTGKVGALGGFASATALVVVALAMGAESISRLFSPQAIHFDEAILVAVVGLVVNLLSAWLLQEGGKHPHAHTHDHAHHHDHFHHDHNLRAAYLHVLADALTSLLAIAALFTGKYFGWVWMDALMGLVGAALITRWGFGLLRETSGELLDEVPDEHAIDHIREAIELSSQDQITDLHLWRLGPGHFGAIISVVTHEPKSPEHYKSLLQNISTLSHITVEVNRCNDCSPH
ncbi:MAG: CDF family Co(II)/Ni(II) efflux transporter DmeF [Gammaproteobacteria bacterium]|nr:CDF family Co(II)/Ni(II) efflux transporter DmeF [Gammaproteobacteria bacterium]